VADPDRHTPPPHCIATATSRARVKPDAVGLLLLPQGHFQIIMSRKYCPLFRSRLDWLSRMLYCSGVWSYVINAFTTPIFMAVPIITIWVGEHTAAYCLSAFRRPAC
jgi:hypothetical protein